VPWTSTLIAAGAMPASHSAASTPSAWLRTLVGTLAIRTSPVASSIRIRSVKVPPTSTPIRFVASMTARDLLSCWWMASDGKPMPRRRGCQARPSRSVRVRAEHALDVAVEIVHELPAVVRAGDRACIPGALRDLDAAMDAHVGERVEGARRIARDHDRLARDAQRRVVAGIRQLLGTSDVEPVERARRGVKRVDASCARDVAVDHSILRVDDDAVSAVARDAACGSGCGISASGS